MALRGVSFLLARMVAPGREPVPRRSSGARAHFVQGTVRSGWLQAASRPRVRGYREVAGNLTPGPFPRGKGSKNIFSCFRSFDRDAFWFGWLLDKERPVVLFYWHGES